jgi:transcription antitermination factor NusG
MLKVQGLGHKRPVSDGAELHMRRQTGKVVASITNSFASLADSASLPAEYLQARWYAAQTCANHEKRVFEQLEQRTVEAYLPRYLSMRRWKDRRVRLELPLFPGYVFVHLALRDRLRVLQTPSVVRLVGFGGQPAPLADHEIDKLRQGLAREMRFEPHPYLRIGQRVRVRTGPLQGLEGILVRRKNVSRLVVSIDLIMRSVAAEIDVADLERAN